MNFLLDENIPYDLMVEFERTGHQVFHIKKLGKTGIKNGEVYALARALDAWIITRDIDFASQAKFLTYNPLGVVFYGLRDTTVRNVISIFRQLLANDAIEFNEPRLIKIFENGLEMIAF
jgi:predicted nuclease of predicted toxin-antitoxin system